MGHCALRVKHSANDSKLETLKELILVYRALVADISEEMMDEFFETGYIKPLMDKNRYKRFNKVISARYAQAAHAQAYGMCSSYIESMAIRIRSAIQKVKLPEDIKHQLHIINKSKAWFKSDIKHKDVVISDAAKEFSIWIFKFYDRDSRFKCDKINMMLNANVAPIESKKANKAIHFDYWIKISSLTKGKKISIPIISNPYFEEYEGKLKNAVQVNFKDDTFTFVFMKEFTDVELKKAEKTLALDIGMKYLFATPHGNLMGIKYAKKLDEMGVKIDKLSKSLRTQNINPITNKRYNDLVRKRRSFMKNEVNRILNRLIRIYKPDLIMIEKLDFKGGEKLSKKTRVRIHNFGKRFINEKLVRLKEKQGIQTQLVRSEYTSQLCFSCGKLEKTNRNGEKYHCDCGYKCHADVNAARNISLRSSWGSKMTKNEIRCALLANYTAQQGLTKTYQCKKDRVVRSGCTYSSANRLRGSTAKSTFLYRVWAEPQEETADQKHFLP